MLAPTPENLARVAKALAAGELAIIPTETVYGLAALAADESALARVFEFKGRPRFDPLIVHVATLDLAELQSQGVIANSLGAAQQRVAEDLVRQFWPGPLTLVLPRGPLVPLLATSGLETVAVRMPGHPVAQALIEASGPLAAPSANRFGRISPTEAAAARRELGDRVRCILDGGPCRVGLESTVVRCEEDGSLTLLRPGGVALEEIAAATGSRVDRPSADPQRPASPGQMARHYAPGKRLRRIEADRLVDFVHAIRGAGWAVLVPTPAELPPNLSLEARVVPLSPSGDPVEAAAALFRTLRALDEDPAVSEILAIGPSQAHGLWAAIDDRLRRASS